MNPLSKTATLSLYLLLITWFPALHAATAQQLQSPPPAGSDTISAIYSPSLNRLSVSGFRGPAGSYGGAFTTNSSQNGPEGLNRTNTKSKEPSDNSLARSAWSGGSASFSNQGTASWTAGATAFGSRDSSWAAGANSFGIPLQTGGVWRTASVAGMPPSSSMGITKATALAGSALSPGSPLGLSSLPPATNFAHRGTGKNVEHLSRSSLGLKEGIRSGLPIGIPGPFGSSKQFSGFSGQSTPQTHSSGGPQSGTGSKRISGTPQQDGLGGFSNPLPKSRDDSNDRIDSGTGSNSDGRQY